MNSRTKVTDTRYKF